MSKLEPWRDTFTGIKQRVTNPNYKCFHRYGGRGIKCLITVDELKELWFRDKAYRMKRPSIDRIDNDGHYEKSNCRYLELEVNGKMMPGSGNRNAKLSEEVVKEMRRMYKPHKMRMKQIAEKFDVSWETVKSALYGYTWASVKRPRPTNSK